MTEPAAVLDALNDDQRRAATYRGGPLLILAGAGTGKTGTLVARAAWLRSQGLQPSRILLLTFTRRAADDMLARAQPRDSNNVADRIVGGTFHAIAHRIIRAHSEAFALPAEFSVLDPADTADVLDTLRDVHGLVGTVGPPHATGIDLRGNLLPVRQHQHQPVRRANRWLPVVRAVRQSACRPVH
jgi:DNA helicase II / ATP-dependent DNA helicase PcrA